MIELIPVAVTSVNWDTYLQAAQQLLGHSVSKVFDKAGISVGSAAFVISAGDLCGNTEISLEDAGKRLKHISVSFLAIMLKDTLYAIMERVSLTITSGDSNRSGFKVALISGDLEIWRQAIIDCSIDNVNMDVRMFANKVQHHFETALGLNGLWYDYSKQTSNDNKTYRLMLK